MKTIKRETHNLELYVENQIKECFKRVGTVSKNLKGERVIEEFTVKPNEILEILYNLVSRAYTEIVEINYEILENDTVKVQVTLVEQEMVIKPEQKIQEVQKSNSAFPYVLGLFLLALALLLTQIEGSTVTPANETLLRDYIAPCLSKYVYYLALPKLIYKVENISVVKRKTDSADPIDFKELNFIRQIAKDEAEFFGTKLSRFLCANSSTYPLYNSPGNTSDTVHPKRDDSYW